MKNIFKFIICIILVTASAANSGANSISKDKQAELISMLAHKPPIYSLSDLSTQLASEDSRLRRLAAREIGEAGEPAMIGGLLKRLGDRNIEVRRQAQLALLKIGRKNPKISMKYIEVARNDLDSKDKAMAEAVLLEIDGRKIKAKEIYRRVFTENQDRFWAAYSGFETRELLAVVNAPLHQHVSLLLSDLKKHIKNPQQAYPQTLLRQAYGFSVFLDALGKRAGARIIALLEAGQRSEAASLKKSLAPYVITGKTLGEFARRFEITLKKHVPEFEFSDYDPGQEMEILGARRRAEAADTLGGVKSAAVTDALIRAVNSDPNALVRSWSAEALCRQKSTKAVRALLKAFPLERHIPVRHAFIQALGCLDTKEARRFVYHQLKDEENKEAAIMAVGRLGSDRDIDFLLKAAYDESFYVRRDKSLGFVTEDRESIRLTIASALEAAADGQKNALEIRLKAQNIRNAVEGEFTELN